MRIPFNTGLLGGIDAAEQGNAHRLSAFSIVLRVSISSVDARGRARDAAFLGLETSAV
jgi:hypothetical protein